MEVLFKEQTEENEKLKEKVNVFQERLTELENINTRIELENSCFQSSLVNSNDQLDTLTVDLYQVYIVNFADVGIVLLIFKIH